MLDGTAKALIDPYLTRMGNRLARLGISADMVTWGGFVIGAAAGLAIAWQFYLTGLVLLLASRLADGLAPPEVRGGAHRGLEQAQLPGRRDGRLFRRPEDDRGTRPALRVRSRS